MLAWWIVGILLIMVFTIGFLLGIKFMISGFKEAVIDPNSPIRHLLNQEAEAFAKKAEQHDEKSQCLLHCGENIAGMIRTHLKELR
jgi:hypothetical protein